MIKSKAKWVDCTSHSVIKAALIHSADAWCSWEPWEWETERSNYCCCNSRVLLHASQVRNYSRKLMMPSALMASIHFSRRCTASRAQVPTSKDYNILYPLPLCRSYMSLGVISVCWCRNAIIRSPEIAHLTFRGFAMSSLTTWSTATCFVLSMSSPLSSALEMCICCSHGDWDLQSFSHQVTWLIIIWVNCFVLMSEVVVPLLSLQEGFTWVT